MFTKKNLYIQADKKVFDPNKITMRVNKSIEFCHTAKFYLRVLFMGFSFVLYFLKVNKNFNVNIIEKI